MTTTTYNTTTVPFLDEYPDGSPQKPPRIDRIAQLCALAVDPNQDTSECARWDLFHELPIDQQIGFRSLPFEE
jgi:hypothetical protein